MTGSQTDKYIGCHLQTSNSLDDSVPIFYKFLRFHASSSVSATASALDTIMASRVFGCKGFLIFAAQANLLSNWGRMTFKIANVKSTQGLLPTFDLGSFWELHISDQHDGFGVW